MSLLVVMLAADATPVTEASTPPLVASTSPPLAVLRRNCPRLTVDLTSVILILFIGRIASCREYAAGRESDQSHLRNWLLGSSKRPRARALAPLQQRGDENAELEEQIQRDGL